MSYLLCLAGNSLANYMYDATGIHKDANTIPVQKIVSEVIQILDRGGNNREMVKYKRLWKAIL